MNTADSKRSCEVHLTVPFFDVDPMNMVWHGNYLKYFDVARSALFEKAGLNLFEYYERTQCLFPITKTATKHILSLRYLDRFSCKAICTEAQYKIVVAFELRLQSTGQLYARGRSEQIGVKYPEAEMLFEIPTEVRMALGFEC